MLKTPTTISLQEVYSYPNLFFNQNPPISDDKWKNNVLENIKRCIDNHGIWAVRFLTFENIDFSPGDIEIYKDLQEQIAELIPVESLRPTIILHIHGGKRKLQDRPDVGLLGGTGPLSDANIINGLISNREGKTDNFYAVLISMPPPRIQQEKLVLFFPHLINYFIKMIKFVYLQKCSYYVLLSNTAHIHANIICKMLDRRTSNFLHMINLITEQVAQDYAERVLVLGTSQAATANLYPAALEKHHIASILPDTTAQEKLQYYINEVKSGHTQDIGDEFILFLYNEIVNLDPPPTHILLGCTEIPLFLKSKNSEGISFEALLQEKLKKNPKFFNNIPKFVDSEERMIHIIDEAQQKKEKQIEDSNNADIFLEQFKAIIVSSIDELDGTDKKEQLQLMKSKFEQCKNIDQIQSFLCDLLDFSENKSNYESIFKNILNQLDQLLSISIPSPVLLQN